ncbi:40S ribosomal protein S15a-5 isoform X1 [Gossypium hirsutum]|uniref:40S ribosomal protein S15a-5 isoform X1 n=1 Tax=Gossypium hirsutum TaxID=3635 RepID=A0ABM2YL17_GOSHI|nr:40S ribosomal protein S15a-5-like isoform X1 [Gossypium hirsutum]
MGRRILKDALRSIVNAEKRGKATVELKPISTVISSFLTIMKDRGYIRNFELFDPHRAGKITVELQGRVNDCRALTYRQDIKAKDIQKYTTFKLPTQQVCPFIAYYIEGAGRLGIGYANVPGYVYRILPTLMLFFDNLYSMQWGYVVISTPDGILDHEEAIRRNVGGQVLGYFH